MTVVIIITTSENEVLKFDASALWDPQQKEQLQAHEAPVFTA
jgi:hypothetical protein